MASSSSFKSGAISLFGFIGCLVSLYAIYIEYNMKYNQDFVPACDFGSFASCSKVLGSSYAHILSHFGVVAKNSTFDLSNATFGLFFYLISILHGKFSPFMYLFFALGALGSSFYLAYILRVVLQDVCVVCISSYVVNFVLFLLATRRYLRSTKVTGTKKD